MDRRDPFRRYAVFILAAAFLAAGTGCGKKAVMTGETTPPGGAAPAPQAVPPAAAPGAIATETVGETPPAALPPGPSTAGTQTAMAEAQAGVAATQESPSLFGDIHFDYDKSFIRADAKPVLEKVAAYLKGNPAARLLVEGHCDERGTPEYNMALGERRAESARSYLVSLGITASRLSTVSFGEEKPVDPGHSEEAWAKNRRAHFVVK